MKKKLTKISLFLCLFFIKIKSNGIFVPNRKIDYSNFPAFTSNLLKDEREKFKKSENKDIEKIMEKVVSGNDKELEKEAEKLVKDKEKLNKFLISVPEDILKEDKAITNSGGASINQQIRTLLLEIYENKELTNKTVTLKLKDADIRYVIELVSKASDLNFIIDPSVSGRISNINIENVSVAAALNVILSSNNPKLALINEFGIWRILKLQDAIKLLKDKSEDFIFKDFVSSFVTIKNIKFTESFKLRVEKMWHGIINDIVNNEKEKSNYYIVFDDNSRKIFFRGRKNNVKDFKKFLNEIDFYLPQVRIEARVIVASKDFEESFGLQISGIYNRSATARRTWDYIGFGDVKSPKGGGDFKEGMIQNWALNLLPSSASQFLNLPLIFGGRDLDARRLNLVLNAAENRNEIKTILKPTLLVNSEEFAEILVGEQVPIETQIQERIEGSVRQLDTINYKDLGMKLKVKPIVNSDKKTVFLDIFVENSYVKDGSTSTSFNAKKSIIATTQSKSRVLLNSGQTTLIGGLITNDKRISKEGVPILQNIPVLGFFFGGSKRTKRDEQLMIFISPTVA
ncbi:hypothetical protein K9L05_03130 [Candidatus Babeliales bacterium]|nr:hypothetical protein [Candidatus Babeliales bacterium]MCF7899614.1 hypothetical protein [Candidatus Babeliales bacterium]